MAVTVSVDPGNKASAHRAGLRYFSDETPGLTRRRQGSGFSYWTVRGRRVRDRSTLARIRAIVIPPAWTQIWICPVPNGHMQATGRDARGRKQYRYHPRWHEVRDEAKYGRLLAFGRALPIIRRRTSAALRQPSLTRTKVLAALVQLLEKTLIRIGNDEYARANGSFGLTTMRDRHVKVKGQTVIFEFKAKSGVRQSVCLSDKRLARTIKRCQELPGQTLFQYEDEEGARQSVDSGDVNDYVRELTGEDFTAKDFRTWAGTVLAARALSALESLATDEARASRDGDAPSETERKRRVAQAVEEVAKKLGNTKAVCRKCYIHPAVIDAFLEGRSLASNGNGRASSIEATVLKLLRRAAASSRNHNGA